MLTIRDSAEDRRKARFEQRITSAFLLVYNRARGAAFSIVRAGTPPEPDLVCQDAKSSSSMGVEVVTVYYDETHAKSVWEQARSNQMSPYFIAKTDDIENRRVLARALREIKKKSKKEYKRLDRTLLLVQVYPLRFYLSDVREVLEAVQIPLSHPFDEIHLSSQYEVYELLPHRRWIFPE